MSVIKFGFEAGLAVYVGVMTYSILISFTKSLLKLPGRKEDKYHTVTSFNRAKENKNEQG